LRAASAFELPPIIAPALSQRAAAGGLRRMRYSRPVTDHTDLCNELTATWHREIPIVAAMGVTVDHYDGESLTVRAPLAPNRNIHGTTFAGSLYTACVLTGWGRIWLALRERGLPGTIYAAESTIRYRKGVTSDFVCRCALDVGAAGAGLDKLATAGRTNFELACTIESGTKLAVSFTGRYAVHAERA
jgi:thioesterase domain-containing protein